MTIPSTHTTNCDKTAQPEVVDEVTKIEIEISAKIAKIVADAQSAQAILDQYPGVYFDDDFRTQALVHIATLRVDTAVDAIVRAVNVPGVDFVKLLSPPPPVQKAE